MKPERIDYDTYIHSDRWAAKRRAFRNSRRKSTCWICGAKQVHFHHRTYVRFGFEDLDDLVPLCQEHHTLLHRFQKALHLTVEEATTRYLAETKRVPARPKATKKRRNRQRSKPVAATQEQLDALAAGMMNRGVEVKRVKARKERASGHPEKTKAQRRKEGLGLVVNPHGWTKL